MASKMNGDKSAWIDQIERARHELMIALRSVPLNAAMTAQVVLVEADIQAFIDRAIDAETGR